ncbi:unnamed protein product [Rotaria socialis]|uniref:CAP-Gly domain-containing protein n=1 Tax=Rotaria socialis TaxID=392032 RepID=A0A817QRN6_9BILA|nr:unnamed protein product [Rotaria socialis]CAF3340372.1 unnamed protein product [Rotaria socialis]CAF3502051.1 unnamed protein product [Rotaria socialis]CAF4209965.1 unnamed protein product [Rotaria socialis]CAF4420760.1 unnamed protein product [Rotaria socialis]
MQHLPLNNFIDYSSIDDSINLEDFISNKNDNPITLTKLFGLLRTWNNIVHKNFTKLISLTLENEVNIDEFDVITGMNLVHFTCKYGAKQFGHEKEAIQVMNLLIEKGINLTAQCLWIKMNCLHYCAFFDSPSICELLLRQSKVLKLLNQTCASFKNGTPLHLACSALSQSTAQFLLQAGANKEILDDQQRTPAVDCIPKPNTQEQQDIADKLLVLLRNQECKQQQQQQSSLIDSIISNADNQNVPQFQIGERVRLANNKTGTIKYFGSVPFGVNLWYGVELDEPTGKHDGCIGGIRYFTCPPNRGIFIQPSSLQRLTPVPYSPERERRFRPINFPILDTASVTSRVDTGLKRENSADGRTSEHFRIDDRVFLSKNRIGTIKYIGPTSLGSGTWYGVELDLPDGLHDGFLSVDGQRYFRCKPQHGVFVRHYNLKKINNNDRLAQSLLHSLDPQTKINSRMTTSEYDTTMIASSIIEDDVFTKSMESSMHSVTFHVGDKVYYQNHLAIVRFIGKTAFAEGIWIGIEFVSRPLGKNDGSVNGRVYFQSKQNHGLFIRPNRLTLTKK